jgi:RNA polymerase sigma-70 factor (ECF subfamily)
MDEKTVIRAQQGDRDAFAALVEATADRLHAVAQGVLRDISRAEDATQQSLLQIWRDLPKLRDPARFDAWAYRITVRICYAEAKKARRLLPGRIDETRLDQAGSDATARIADRDQLERAFEHLSLDHRTVVVMRHYLEMPLEQIAESLSIPVDTVRSRLYHAMRGLRAALDADAREVRPAAERQEALS